MSQVWVCDSCGGKYWPQVVEGTGKCPGCGGPTGHVHELTDEERNTGASR